MAPITQLQPSALPGARYGSFAGKTPAAGGSALLLRLMTDLSEDAIMAKSVLKGSTDVSVRMRFVDSTDGTPEEGVTATPGGLSIQYHREGAEPQELGVEDLSSLDAEHSDAGMRHIADGYYRVDLPDAAFDTGANSVLITGKATGMVGVGMEFHLVDYDPQDAADLGLTTVNTNLAAPISTRATPAEGNSEVSEVLKTDTISELTDDPGGTGGTPTFEGALMLLYMALRNKMTTTSSDMKIHNNAGAEILESTLSDSEGTFTRNKLSS